MLASTFIAVLSRHDASADKVNTELIAAQGSLVRAQLQLDDTLDHAGTWYYFLEDIDTAGC